MKGEDPDCLDCRSYYVTHEPTWPHGCRAFEFRSRRLPAEVVRESSGEACAAHRPRIRPAAGKPVTEER